MIPAMFSRGVLAGKFAQYRANDTRFDRLADCAKKAFDASGLTAHNWAHVYRDTLNAIVVGEAEGADMNIVLPAITLHDIGFLYGANGKTHHIVGAEKVAEFLAQNNVEYSKDVISHIVACVRTHKGSMFGERPATLEAKVVCDADMIEKFGIFGVYSGIRTHTEFNDDIKKIIERNTKGMDALHFETETGAEIGEKGRQFVVDFFTKLDEANDTYRE